MFLVVVVDHGQPVHREVIFECVEKVNRLLEKRGQPAGGDNLHRAVALGLDAFADLAHQPDEWIGIGDMVDSGKVMALALHRLLGA